ncbi:response regulator [Persicimonas caeni]|uniref:Response regulator n=1 Tax=Persicimonas caeni TaxID=2292766 RepID=A0A4Y6Q1F0_PERCE|nr:chemotaxis protein CheB [Persicimonas caeni]QDG54342.1 response regulator [Persicimonas caeni]QED35563.1 response regulator [Persicimonas caeni]
MANSRSSSRGGDDSFVDPRGLLVGVGASAGGLDALRSLFGALPAYPGMSFLVVQHQAPSQKSLLPELIAQVTPMQVTEAEPDEMIRPNRVYVCPPQTVLSVEGMRIRLREVESPDERRTPISRFLESLADAHGRRAVGVILSGAGSDGTFGLRAISDAGGMTLVQDCKSAQFDSMPRSAIATGVADFELPPEQMPEVLGEHLEYLERLDARESDDLLAHQILEAIDGIADAVREETRHDFGSYKSSTLVRRIKRRMQILRITSVDAYVERLREEPAEAGALCQELLISVTAFFRDAAAFQALEREVIPKLFEGREVNDRVRIWIPGCATGQEAYSFAMLVCEYLDSRPDDEPLPSVQIFATDIDESAIRVARQGVYSTRAVDQLSEERLGEFFIRRGEQLQVSSRLREMCLFSVHNVISDPPFSSLDLISCRNMLIYFDASLQKRVVPLFHYSLEEDGFLFLGSSETLTSHKDLFAAVDSRHRIWKRRADAPRRLVTPPKMSQNWRPSRLAPKARQVPDIYDTMQQVLLERYAPEAIIVSGEGEVLCACEEAGDFLQIAGGVFQNNVVKMARSGLRVGIRTALAEVRKTGERIERDDLSIKTDTGIQPVKLSIEPLPHAARDADLYIIVFERIGSVMGALPTNVRSPDEEAESLIVHLERELSSTRDDLECTVQELEASNEELKSTNEELLSMNEELQSANEELEVSKEELEAANQALSRANADLENLLMSTQLATVFLKDDGTVQRFTPAIVRIYHLPDQDIGRPLSHINHRLKEMPPLPDPDELRRREAAIEHEVRTPDGDFYIRRVLPYFTPDGPDAGMVVTFIDVTELKRAQERASRLAALVESSSEAIIGESLDGTITAWNRGAEAIYGYTAEEAVGKDMSLVIPAERQDELEQVMRRVRAGECVEPFETVRVDQQGNRLHVWLTLSPVTDSREQVVGISAIARDVTALKVAEDELLQRSVQLSQAKKKADAANQAKSQFLANMSHEIRTPMTAILGYAEVLRAHTENPDDLQCVETIKRNADYLLEIINDILDLSKIEAGKLDLDLSRVAPDELLAEVISLMQVRAEEKRIPLSLEFVGKLPRYIETDPKRLRQVLINLVGNAIKFTDDGQVRVRASFEGEGRPMLCFDVADTGIGIPAEQQDGLFEPFSQVTSPDKAKHDGTGLGLTICKRLVDALGGEILVDSARGEGSTFSVKVPVRSSNDLELVEPRQGIMIPQEPRVSNERCIDARVLVVDDRHDIRYLARFFLERSGAEVEVAENGAQAVARVDEARSAGTPFDIVVMDMQMPVMDGYEAARQLRANGFELPILALTAAAMPADRERCFEAGCTDYTSKPIDGHVLVERIAHLCGVGQGDQSRAINELPTHAAMPSVLLVDDSVDTCNAWQILLEMEGIAVSTCQTGAEAIELAAEASPEVVVLDLGLPDISGYELVEQMTELDALANATFIALSGRSQPEDIERSLASGFDHHLVKPAGRHDLLALFETSDPPKPALDG